MRWSIVSFEEKRNICVDEWMRRLEEGQVLYLKKTNTMQHVIRVRKFLTYFLVILIQLNQFKKTPPSFLIPPSLSLSCKSALGKKKSEEAWPWSWGMIYTCVICSTRRFPKLSANNKICEIMSSYFIWSNHWYEFLSEDPFLWRNQCRI